MFREKFIHIVAGAGVGQGHGQGSDRVMTAAKPKNGADNEAEHDADPRLVQEPHPLFLEGPDGEDEEKHLGQEVRAVSRWWWEVPGVRHHLHF